jgi:hypothetical protein
MSSRLAVLVIVVGAVLILFFAGRVGYVIGVNTFRADEDQEEARENAVEANTRTQPAQSTSAPTSSPMGRPASPSRP